MRQPTTEWLFHDDLQSDASSGRLHQVINFLACHCSDLHSQLTRCALYLQELFLRRGGLADFLGELWMQIGNVFDFACPIRVQ